MTAFRATALRWSTAAAIGAVGFSLFVLMVGANPFAVFDAMGTAMFAEPTTLGDVLVKAAPIVLCALAVAIPARAGLWNLGAEGQLTMGLVGSAGASLIVPTDLGTVPTLLFIGLAGMLFGAVWGAIAGALRVSVGLNEAISSLLLNYVALKILDWVVNGPWKDPANLGFPGGTELSEAQRLPTMSVLGNPSVHIGVLIALAAVLVVAFLTSRTRWGFALRVVGGNPEAARRSGMLVWLAIGSAMLVGGALAGLAGMVQLTGYEGQIRQGIPATYGFLGFLASWLSGHHPFWLTVAGVGIAALTVSGDALQVVADLPGAAVNILMALLLIAVLATRPRTDARGTS